MDQQRKPVGQGFWRELAGLLRDTLLKLGLILLMAAMLCLLPVLLPLALAASWLDRRRMRGAASRTACLRCGQILGRAALERADEVWAAEMRSMWDSHAGVRFQGRVVRTLYAICPACGARYGYDEDARAFRPAPDVPADPAAPLTNGIP